MPKIFQKLFPKWLKLAIFNAGGRKPFSKGYGTFKFRYIKNMLDNQEIVKKFKNFESLPKKYGFALDERVVEYPWVLLKISELKAGNLLDAGSSLNFQEILDYKNLENKKITILNLNPEPDCFLQKGVSYIFGDIRSTPFKEGYFDCITCISTLEHIGMDNNVLYIKDAKYKEEGVFDFEKAVLELKRVLKNEGKILITVPFGRYKNFGWFQQFDSKMVARVVEVFQPKNYQIFYYKYTKGGWNISDEKSCKDCEYFDVRATKYFDKKSSSGFDEDFAAASRAVACLELIK